MRQQYEDLRSVYGPIYIDPRLERLAQMIGELEDMLGAGERQEVLL